MTGGLLKVRLLAAASGAFLLMACAEKDKTAYVERQVNDIYNSAMDRLEAKDYKKAASLFDEVERQHPYSVWATKSQLMAGVVTFLIVYRYFQYLQKKKRSM